MHKASIPHDALVLVGDGARAIFFRNKGTVLRPELVAERLLEQENPPTREQGTDKPGRLAPGFPSTQRSAIQPADWHQIQEDRFASTIADALYQLAHANRFQRLVIVAPPKVLGTLRKSLHKEVVERIEAEVPKELASYDVPRIQRELAEWH